MAPEPATDILTRLRHAITTASNDDTSPPETTLRRRHSERIAAMGDAVARIEHLELVMRECCDAIRDNDEFGALRMLEVALTDPGAATNTNHQRRN